MERDESESKGDDREVKSLRQVKKVLLVFHNSFKKKLKRSPHEKIGNNHREALDNDFDHLESSRPRKRFRKSMPKCFSSFVAIAAPVNPTHTTMYRRRGSAQRKPKEKRFLSTTWRKARTTMDDKSTTTIPVSIQVRSFSMNERNFT